MPRVGIYSSLKIIPDKKKRLEQIFNPNWNPHSEIILESSPDITISSQATGSAKITSYKPNSVTIQTNTSGGPSMLLLTDSYYPSWRAQIDGVPTKIFKANHTFRAVVVPSGLHEIKFSIHWP